jgi:glucokinase
VRAGLDLGGTKIQAVVTDGEAGALGSARRETPTDEGADAVVRELAGAVRDALDEAGVEVAALTGVGVGAPGSIDVESGTVLKAANIEAWREPYPLADRLEEELALPVVVGNDVSVAVEAERRYGAGRAYGSFLGVFWGTGVGGGLVVDGRTLHGRGSAGEIGHVPAKAGGRRCACGLRGCVEAYAGRGAMEERARALARRRKTQLFEIQRRRGRPRLTSGVWARALAEDDELARELLERAVRALAVGIGAAVNLLDVEAVVVGGGLGLRLGEEWLELLEAASRKHVFFSEPPAFHLAELGDLGGAIGASLLAPA